jgi:hypothetical protein
VPHDDKRERKQNHEHRSFNLMASQHSRLNFHIITSISGLFSGQATLSTE